MARPRKELSKMLKEILPDLKYFYFSPPSGLQMMYPCLVYKLEGDAVQKADNMKYLKQKRYTITIIDENPDSLFPEQLERLDYCTFDRAFASDNLNHFVYTLYY